MIAPGVRFGELTVEQEAQRRHTGERQVSLRCDCGRAALRTFNYLKHLPAGRKPACSECLSEWRRGTTEDRRAWRKLGWLRQYERSGSLYSAEWESVVFDELCESFDRREYIDEPILIASEVESSVRSPGHGICIFPIESKAGWQCHGCSKAFTVGYGCTSCVVPLCPGCVDKHSDGEGRMTLEQIGLIYEVNRERIRQIEGKALRRLRHPSRARHLRPFLPECDRSIGVLEETEQENGQ